MRGRWETVSSIDGRIDVNGDAHAHPPRRVGDHLQQDVGVRRTSVVMTVIRTRHRQWNFFPARSRLLRLYVGEHQSAIGAPFARLHVLAYAPGGNGHGCRPQGAPPSCAAPRYAATPPRRDHGGTAFAGIHAHHHGCSFVCRCPENTGVRRSSHVAGIRHRLLGDQLADEPTRMDRSAPA